ncbi:MULTISPECIES: DUF3597 domain-containing protein [unclassified Aureimonas]|uniref:DUF3597 domain-containing protein n=1 Tax=unclassified Aureimonas TaxID=2615206 RepID=UPI0006F6A119|nr:MULTISPECIES: DUF3597 domain-containing protein [unclassified Aureimonas]KQT60708.1 hypothetical protein ASG54_24960 [Aureimonas sp. Leaf460]KQT68837.1 hypothetical protein ASG62_18480 [Aureimonas sp. Leaf427]
MSIFGKIKDAIFGKAEAAEPAAPAPATVNAPPPAGPATTAAPAPASPTPASPTSAPAPGAQPAGTAPASTPATAVDVAAIMDKAVKDSGQKLEWRKSIVDTMKALHLDSSLSERKELAEELGYTGDTNDSATMNVWLQKALMKKLAENGGKVPADLTD